jgi:hypothetical protein
MPTTPRFALRYPAQSDAPNVPVDMQELASDVEGQLARAFPCLSTARPASPPLGMLIFETDTSLILIWDGDSWNTVVAPAGGGGGGTTAHAQFSAASAQSVPNAANATCAFGTTDTSSALVTRASRGAGHQFTLGASGIWVITGTTRYASAAVTGERYAGLHTGASEGSPLAGQGQSPPSGNPVTNNFGVAKSFASGAVVFVNLYQSTGGARLLEPHASGGWVRINFALVG